MTRNAVLWLFVLLPGAGSLWAQPGAVPLPHERIDRDGIRVEYWIDRPNSSAPRRLREGEEAVVRIKLTDSAAGIPIAGSPPAAWLYSRREPQPDGSCDEVVKRFLGGSIFARPDLDLNSYYVLALNDDPSITVVDPLFGYGNTKLLAMIPLRGRGDDWVLTADQRTLYVSMPDAHEVAVVDTASWKLVTNIAVGEAPSRVLLQPDEHYLWVGTETGVSAISTTNMTVAARIPTGMGRHDLACDGKNRAVFITNSDSNSVSVIDIAHLTRFASVAVGSGPVSIAYSNLSQMAYVANERDGSVAVLDGTNFNKIAAMKLDAGIRQVRIAPGGRHGFVTNVKENRIYVFDTASNRVIHTAGIDGGPDRVAFSESIAYIHRLGSEIVQMIPLDTVGAAGQQLQVIDFPAGRYALGAMDHLSAADAIVPAAGEPAVLVANPADKAIYFYKEGMAAPIGSFSNYSHEPRAVLVVNRSLRQSGPGVFETSAQLPKPGPYGLAVFLDSPRVIACFEGIRVDPNPEIEAQRSATIADIEILLEARTVAAGQPLKLRFKVVDHQTKALKTGVRDLRVLVFHASGMWQRREWATAIEDGIYQVEVTLPRAGAYHVTLECPSLNTSYQTAPNVIIEAQE